MSASHFFAFSLGALAYHTWIKIDTNAKYARLLPGYRKEMYGLSETAISYENKKRFLQLSDWMLLPRDVALFIQPGDLDVSEYMKHLDESSK